MAAEIAATLQRRRFAEEYAKDFNGTQAAIRAGYSRKTAHVQASRLLKYAEVREYLTELVARGARKNEITVERTMEHIARVAYGDVRQLYDQNGNMRPMHELDDDAAALVSAVEQEEIFVGAGEERRNVGVVRKIKTNSKLNGLEKCMSILSMHKSLAPSAASGFTLNIYRSNEKRPRR